LKVSFVFLNSSQWNY